MKIKNEIKELLAGQRVLLTKLNIHEEQQLNQPSKLMPPLSRTGTVQ